MKDHSPEELLAKARRVYRDSELDDLPIPPGFAERAIGNLDQASLSGIDLWERASYAGAALAACFVLMAWVSGTVAESSGADTSSPAAAWLDMPMQRGF